MALLFLDSFDHWASADVLTKYFTSNFTAGGATINATAGRRGGGCAQSWGGGELTTNNLAPASTTAILGVALKFTTLPGSPTPLLCVLSAGTIQLSVTIDNVGKLAVYRGSASTLLGTATMSGLPLNAFAYIELKTVIHPSAGTAVVRVNEATVLTLSGVNTAQTGVAAWDSIRLRAVQDTYYYDDLYILDGSGSAPNNDLLGDCRVDARYPTAAGATTGWTPSAGANWAAVDDPTPNADTDYVSAATVGLTDTYTIQDAPVPGAALYGAQLCVSVDKSDAGTCSVAPVVRHSGVDYPGTAINPGTSYSYLVTPYSTNPGTGAAWTEAGFNAAEFGVKRTA